MTIKRGHPGYSTVHLLLLLFLLLLLLLQAATRTSATGDICYAERQPPKCNIKTSVAREWTREMKTTWGSVQMNVTFDTSKVKRNSTPVAVFPRVRNLAIGVLVASGQAICGRDGTDSSPEMRSVDCLKNDDVVDHLNEILLLFPNILFLKLQSFDGSLLVYSLPFVNFNFLEHLIVKNFRVHGKDSLAFVSKSFSTLEFEGAGIRSLEEIDFGGCCKKLKNLFLGYNDIDSVSRPARLEELRALDYLILRNNKIRRIDDENFIRSIDGLRSLNLNENLIEYIGTSAFTGLRFLKTISLGKNRLNAILEFHAFPGWPDALRKLVLNGNNITELRSDLLANLPPLSLLDLSNNSLATVRLTSLHGLEKLLLSNNSMRHFDIVGPSGNLKILRVDGNLLSNVSSVLAAFDSSTGRTFEMDLSRNPWRNCRAFKDRTGDASPPFSDGLFYVWNFTRLPRVLKMRNFLQFSCFESVRRPSPNLLPTSGIDLHSESRLHPGSQSSSSARSPVATTPNESRANFTARMAVEETDAQASSQPTSWISSPSSGAATPELSSPFESASMDGGSEEPSVMPFFTPSLGDVSVSKSREEPGEFQTSAGLEGSPSTFRFVETPREKSTPAELHRELQKTAPAVGLETSSKSSKSDVDGGSTGERIISPTSSGHGPVVNSTHRREHAVAAGSTKLASIFASSSQTTVGLDSSPSFDASDNETQTTFNDPKSYLPSKSPTSGKERPESTSDPLTEQPLAIEIKTTTSRSSDDMTVRYDNSRGEQAGASSPSSSTSAYRSSEQSSRRYPSSVVKDVPQLTEETHATLPRTSPLARFSSKEHSGHSGIGKVTPIQKMARAYSTFSTRFVGPSASSRWLRTDERSTSTVGTKLDPAYKSKFNNFTKHHTVPDEFFVPERMPSLYHESNSHCDKISQPAPFLTVLCFINAIVGFGQHVKSQPAVST